MGRELIWDNSSRAWRDGAAGLENRLGLGNDSLMGCPKGKGRGKWSLFDGSTNRVSMGQFGFLLMWDGHSLDEAGGENRFFVIIEGLGIDT